MSTNISGYTDEELLRIAVSSTHVARHRGIPIGGVRNDRT
jgi:hypothetical protein